MSRDQHNDTLFSMEDDGSFFDDDELMRPPLFTYQSSNKPLYISRDLKNIIRLVNININVYNINIKKFIKFITSLEENIKIIESNIKIIFSNVTKLLNRIIIERNYDMGLYEALKTIIEKYYIHYLKIWENILTSLWRFSEATERAHKQYAWLLKKTCWIMRNGHLNLKLDDDSRQQNNEISAFVIKEKGLRDVRRLVNDQLQLLRAAN